MSNERCFHKTNNNNFAIEPTRVHSSVVEHLTADQEVTGSNPVGPYCYMFFVLSMQSNEVQKSEIKNGVARVRTGDLQCVRLT